MKYTPWLFLLCSLSLWHCQTKQSPKLRIATAANMQFAMTALSDAFSKEHNIACDVIISSSGKLTAQIMEGAPYDVFVSADLKYPDILYKEGRATNPPKIYAYGQLVLWSMSREVALANLEKPDIKHIALANPKLAPYGEAAIDVLTRLGLYEAVKEKLVFGESIAQVNQFIHTKAADVGFTSLSVIHALEEENKGHWLLLEKHSYSPIAQGIVLLKNKNQLNTAAQAFYDFMFSEKAKAILVENGFLVE
jgi:molybdate transport system substrate-binding protein